MRVQLGVTIEDRLRGLNNENGAPGGTLYDKTPLRVQVLNVMVLLGLFRYQKP